MTEIGSWTDGHARGLAFFIADRGGEVGRVRIDEEGDIIVTTLGEGEWRIEPEGGAIPLVGPVTKGARLEYRPATREGGRRWTVEYRSSPKEGWSTMPLRFSDQETAEEWIAEDAR